MSNRFFTILVIPEKTSQVRRFVVPSWLARGTVIGTIMAVVVAAIMIFDYGYVMTQVADYHQLKLENRRLETQVQIYKSRMSTIENTMDRIKTFSTRLKVITNIEDRGSLLQSLNQKPLPDAATNIGTASAAPAAHPASSNSSAAPAPASVIGGTPTADAAENQAIQAQLSSLNQDSSVLEQTLQDQYELLVDQKAFLAALPTRKPVVGYYTSGFGIRRSPYGGQDKMHEGIDIANHPGTPIHATADGVVVFAATKSGYGQTVVIDHGYGLQTWYGHTRKILVKRGQRVHRGDVIALLGSTGRSTGPHVHYEVRVHGTPVDPLSYILEN